MKVQGSWKIITLVIVSLLAISALVKVVGKPRVLEKQTGTATYYAERFHGKKTASGIKFDQNALMAAHHRWPFGTVVRVINQENKRSVQVKIVDRLSRRATAIVDLSSKAARELRFRRTGQGRVPVRLEVLEWGSS